MVKNYTFVYCVLILVFSQFLNAQVGIGTSNPQATLHVQGNLRVTSTNNTCTSDKLTGTGVSGDITDVAIGEGLTLNANVLSSNAVIDQTKYKIAFFNFKTTAPNQSFDNVDFFLNTTNRDKVVFRVTASHNFTITGITGGVDGRHIIIYNSSSVNMSVTHLGSSVPANNIDTLGSSTATSGVGTIEMVYDGTSQRWIVINIRD